jgi:phage gp29-like protein
MFGRIINAAKSAFNKQGTNLKKGQMPISANRVRAELKALREALSEAEGAFVDYRRRVKMQQIFQETKMDGHVIACMGARKSLTLKKEFAIKNAAGEIDEEWTKFFKQKWFSVILNSILDAQFFGYSLINWTEIKDNKLCGLQVIRRDLVRPDTGLYVNYPYANTGVEFDSDDVKDWCLYTDTADDLGYSNCGYGLLFPVSAYVIAIRNNLGYNADFVEKFIMPFVVAKTMKREGEERQLLEDGIANMASNNSVVLDPTDTIEFIEAKNTGSAYNAFDNLENRCEKKISKIILGHADAIDSTTGKLGATGKDDAVSEALENVEMADNMFVQYQINDTLLDKLRNLGFAIPKGYTFEFLNMNEKVEKLNKESEVNQKFATVVKTLYDAGHEVDSAYIEKTTGIPATKKVDILPKTNVTKAVKNLYDGL